MSEMMSVRGRITLFILSPLLLVSVIVGYWAYQNTLGHAESRFDSSLLATASAIARDFAASDGDALSLETRDLISDTSGGQVFYHVYAPDGVFVTGYATPPVTSPASTAERLQYYDAAYHGTSVRVLKLRNDLRIDDLIGTFSFTVWQDTSVREAFVKDQTWQTFVVIGTLATSVALIVWVGVGIGLRPLLDLQHAISIRSSTDLTPIRRAVPVEVKGVVGTLNSLLGQVSESMEAKNVFISNAAHQLRNPMAGIIAMAEAVKSAPDGETAMARTQELYESAQHASDLANKLISFERANQSGNEQFHEKLDLNEIVKASVQQGQGRTNDRIILAAEFPESALWVIGDAVMLEEAVSNLIDNSLKYGGSALTKVAVKVFIRDTSAVVEVVDNGVGMKETQINKALERFGQINPGSGSGLGLSIVQSVAEGHGGQFLLTANDRGLTATIKLPLV